MSVADSIDMFSISCQLMKSAMFDGASQMLFLWNSHVSEAQSCGRVEVSCATGPRVSLSQSGKPEVSSDCDWEDFAAILDKQEFVIVVAAFPILFAVFRAGESNRVEVDVSFC